ncbi:5-methyltetrahydropteroyltriglutamate---homocysteine S-methyltransferase [Synchytrium endobioticum]|nr:5-methyltetrahydropteroyltriglutamate---homocysteine S-methyltransferase [Synchytrium endobioticum]
MTVPSAVLGFPRIGAQRELKKAIESYWAGKLSEQELRAVAANVKTGNWRLLQQAGVEGIPSADFTLYDHVLDTLVMFNATPERYRETSLSPLDKYFAMGRGHQDPSKGVDLASMEMKKWFDTNYHYIVPEISPKTDFKLIANKSLEEYKEAQSLGIRTRPVLVGPITFLAISKPGADSPGFDPLDKLDKLVSAYQQALKELKDAGVEWVQMDEPILVLDRGDSLAQKLSSVYTKLAESAPKIMLTTYFGRLGTTSLEVIPNIPQLGGVHIDLSERAGTDHLQPTLAALKKNDNIVLSLGVISGRNIWKSDLGKAIQLVDEASKALGSLNRVQVATSSSLLHTPITLADEKHFTDQQKSWFAFATEKVHELVALAKRDEHKLKENSASIQERREFERQSDPGVRQRLAGITPDMLKRKNCFSQRAKVQEAEFKLPMFPTTTIGSFPQTKEIRVARAQFGKGTLDAAGYEKAMKAEIEHVVRFQEEIGLDVLVHGEPERNDMVQYFGEQMKGFVFTDNGWVQSYGTRCVRPPIVVSDVDRLKPMTVDWIMHAQSLTKKPMKGMLTGPITILMWSFPRIDISRELQAKQIALALRDEVTDLEEAGIKVIQVDEPAIREGLPLRRVDWDTYLRWAVDSFRLATSCVKDVTQVHSHFCYSDFNDIFQSIKDLDADVISIEASKSSMKLLKVFKEQSYTNFIGPGVFDIHSPRIPSVDEIRQHIKSMVQYIGPNILWVNPDCGLKTRQWKEVEGALKNTVEAARWARQEYAK